jgi:hypothetical protein
MNHKDLKNGKENKKEDRLQDNMFIKVFVTIEFEVEKLCPMFIIYLRILMLNHNVLQRP